MQEIAAVLPLLATPKKIFITTHHKPDGDALGSSLGLYHFLKEKGHDPVVVAPSDVPDFLQWLPGVNTVLNFEAVTKAGLKALESCDLIFCLDFSRVDRIKLMEPYLRAAGQTKVLIDHHLNPETDFFQYGICQPEKSSTCEMVYDFIKMADPEYRWKQETMQCIYTGLMTDTGSFRFPATTASVHDILADFKRRGLEHSLIHEHVYDVWSENRMRLLGYVLLEKMEIDREHQAGIITLTAEELQRFHVTTGDTEGLVNYPTTIDGIRIAVLLTERKDEIKLSFRSKGNIDVSTFAQKYFNGGGHFNAAGGSSKEDMNTTVSRLKMLIHNHQI